MKRSHAFTLVEMIIILLIVNCLITASVIGLVGLRSTFEFRYSVNQVLSDIRMIQQLADTSMQLCSIDFSLGGNSYSLTKGGQVIRSSTVSPSIKFSGKDHFNFVHSGFTDVGGSGTLVMASGSRSKSIIVSSRGRIRVE